MKIEYLRYFLAVADNLSFTRAAKKQHIAQTAMSKYIALLEKEIGVRLLDRNNRKVQLTALGEQFYKDISLVLKNYDQALHNLHLMVNGSQGTLRIGVGIFEHVFVSQLLQQFHEQYPQIQVLVSQYTYNILWEKALAGAFDIVFPYPFFKHVFQEGNFYLKNLFKFRYCVILNGTNPLAKQSIIKASDFANQCVVTLSEDDGPTDLRRFWINSDKVGVKPRKLVQVNTLNSLFSMLHADYGIGFAPDFMRPFLPSGVVLRQQNAYPEDYYFTLIPKNNTNPALTCFLNLLSSNNRFWERYAVDKN
jgi:DNA-binding transcriptional LysR family regulator